MKAFHLSFDTVHQMSVFQVLLLIFIGSQRSTAIPTALSSSLETHSPEIPQENVPPQSSDVEEDKGLVHHWYCQPDSGYIQEQILLTTKMLHESEEVTKKQNDISTDETVLFLGKAGSGKTSLVQFLTQNPKLLSKIVNTKTGEYIIEDGERIGTSATESFTLYPEIVSYNSTINFCDSPGFHDSRSSAHELVSMDVMKSITNRLKKTKILLLENHSSLQYGISKDSFINTLQHLNDFVVDIAKYRDHIALIATKIPLTFKATDDNINVESGTVTTEIVTEEMHIESIVGYLNHIETSIEEKLKQEISKSKRDFYQKVIGLLKSLQTRDEDGKLTRINVFRRPYKSGPLKNMTLLEKNRESLLQTVKNLNFVEVNQKDFDFTLSNEAQMYLECLLKLTSDNYKNKINELAFKLNEYVVHKTQNYTSFHQVLSDLISLHDALRQLSKNLDETKNYNEFFEKVHGFISDQKIQLMYNYNKRLDILEKYEEMLMKFIDTSVIFTPSSWTLPIRQVIKSTEDELEWYQTLNKFIGGLSSYETQKNKTEIYKTISHHNFTSVNDFMMLFMGVTGSTHFKQYIDAQADAKKRSEIESIVDSLLRERSNITCDSNGKLTVKGFQLRLAEINSEQLVRFYCNNTTLKEVALLAVDTIFLDEDTDHLFKGVDLFISAPNWKIIGQRRIVLSGQPGLDISGDRYLDNGKDGRPGLPGGNGGNFLGIGLHFTNGKNLRIESNGGTGGSGADGAKGDKGNDGMNAAEKFKLGIHSNVSTWFTRGLATNDMKDSLVKNYTEEAFVIVSPRYEDCSLTIITEIQVIREDGECGCNGSPGGFGGEAGIGGFSGNQKLIELGDSSNIQLEINNGSLGKRGNMGRSGEQGLDGIGMICVNVIGLVEGYYKDTSYWKCESTNSSSEICNKDHKLNKSVEYTATGIKHPAPRKPSDFSNYLLDYAILMKVHINHTLFNKIITDFSESFTKNSHKI